MTKPRGDSLFISMIGSDEVRYFSALRMTITTSDETYFFAVVSSRGLAPSDRFGAVLGGVFQERVPGVRGVGQSSAGGFERVEQLRGSDKGVGRCGLQAFEHVEEGGRQRLGRLVAAAAGSERGPSCPQLPQRLQIAGNRSRVVDAGQPIRFADADQLEHADAREHDRARR